MIRTENHHWTLSAAVHAFAQRRSYRQNYVSNYAEDSSNPAVRCALRGQWSTPVWPSSIGAYSFTDGRELAQHAHRRRLSSSYYACPLILVMRHSEKRSKHQCCDGNAANGPQPTCDLRVAFDGHRGRAICFTCDGQVIRAYEGETVAAALLAQGRRVLRTTSRESQPRGVFCNMGICFDCLVEIDGRPNRRACQSFVVEGMRVRTQCGVGQWELPK